VNFQTIVLDSMFKIFNDGDKYRIPVIKSYFKFNKNNKIHPIISSTTSLLKLIFRLSCKITIIIYKSHNKMKCVTTILVIIFICVLYNY